MINSPKSLALFLLFEWVAYNAGLALVLFITASKFDRTELTTIIGMACLSAIAAIWTWIIERK